MTDAHGVAREQLRAFIERIERLEEEKKSIADDIKDVYGEAKGMGYDTKILRKVIAIRKQDRDERAEQEAILDSYLAALGMIEQPSFFDDEPVQPAPAARQPAVPLRSDAGLSILTKHEDIRTAPVTAEEACRASEEAAPVAGRPAEPANSLPTEGCGYAHTEGNATQSGVTAGETATDSAGSSSGKASDFGSEDAGSIPAPASSSDQRAKGDERHGISRGDWIAGDETQTSNTGEGAANTALPANGVTMEYCPPTGVRRLSFAHCFPEPSKDQRAALERDIIDNRVQVPIIRQGNVILDGWARYTIARSLGQSYPVKEYDGDDELLDVIEWQRASRNFTPAQEKKIAADLAKAMPDRADDIMAAFGLAEELEAAE